MTVLELVPAIDRLTKVYVGSVPTSGAEDSRVSTGSNMAGALMSTAEAIPHEPDIIASGVSL